MDRLATPRQRVTAQKRNRRREGAGCRSARDHSCVAFSFGSCKRRTTLPSTGTACSITSKPLPSLCGNATPMRIQSCSAAPLRSNSRTV